MFLIIIIGAMLASLLVSWRLKSKFRQYSQIPLAKGVSGKEAAEKMLGDYGIRDVSIISVEGQLTDHYNPMNKTVNLSHDVYYGRNAAAVAVATHECGHAVQHAKAYSMLKLRSKLAPVQAVSGQILSTVMMISFIGGFALSSFEPMLYVIVACTGILTLFAFITLPVEFDASNRALAWMNSSGFVSSKEHTMAKDALWWAAMTYVVAAIGALAQLLYFVMMLLGNRDE